MYNKVYRVSVWSLFLTVLGTLTLVLPSCTSEQEELYRDVVFSVSMDDIIFGEELPSKTKAGTDNAQYVNRCIMEVFYKGQSCGRTVVAVTDKKASVTFPLVANRTYDVAFWADCATASGDAGFTDLYYNTSSLKAVSLITPYAGSDAKRDAFFGFENGVAVTSSASVSEVTLKRPFAQVNILTTDGSTLADDKKADYVTVTFLNAYTAFNALTGEGISPSSLSYTAAVQGDYPTSVGMAHQLSTDFIFAPAAKQTMDIQMTAYKGDMTVSVTQLTAHTFTSVPYQRNYRTNITGALLTPASNVAEKPFSSVVFPK